MLIQKLGETAWQVPTVTAYIDERAIQSIVEQSPDLLPGADGGRMAVATEVAIPNTGYVDIVGIDADGMITLVECKLRANPEIRRHVVGQVFAYAAGLWGLSYDEFNSAFSSAAGAAIAERVAQLAGPDWDEEAFRSSVTANLHAGRFRLVIAVDEITDELSRIVRFLNGHTSPELQVLALELGYVAHEGVEILMPKVFGTEGALDKAATVAGKTWNEPAFYAAIAEVTTAAGFRAVERFYALAHKAGATMLWGYGPMPAVSALVPIGGRPTNIYTIYQWPKGKVGLSVNFEYFAQRAPAEALAQLVAALRLIPDVGPRLAELESTNFKKRPKLSIDDELCRPNVADPVETALADFMTNASDPTT